ncbi:hypothetical protein [Endozoicomonas sp. ONNA2]|uniref:hypothetical protein n=1 Tax=Endozoicomonas sp. ONNA2 TaxID=2828741 RepID=UPI0021482FD4|nr:hypothetical protein [Endozoicomonas sp. ONNA2]
MDFNTLSQLFGIQNQALKHKTLSLKSNDLPDSLNSFFTRGYENRAINLNSIELVEYDEDKQSIRIKGKSAYLNVPNVETELISWIDDDVNVQMVTYYKLLDENPGPNDWRFSKSFPQLPKTPDENEFLLFNRQTGESWQPERVPLDDFSFFNASFVVSSGNLIDPRDQRQLNTGINFIGMVRPEGPVAIAANAFQVTTALTVSGTIRPPVQGETPTDLKARFQQDGSNFLFPWHVANQMEGTVPGILLTIEVGINSVFGQKVIQIKGDSLIVYTPISDEWVLTDTNPAFRPVQAFNGSVALPNAGIQTNLSMPYEPGINEWYGIAECEGLSLTNLSSMAGISGSDNGFIDHLPNELQKLVKGLGKLELTGFSLLVNYARLSDICVKDATVVVGMPELDWEIWPDLFTLSSIACTFKVRNPFSNKDRRTTTKLTARMNIGSVGCSVTADSSDGFALYATKDSGESIPLGQLLNKYAPEIPLPADMTISTLRLGVEPGRSYSMAMTMDGEDGSFSIPVGPTTLEVDDVSMYIAYQQSQGFRGSVSGKMMLNKNELRLTYSTPGDVLIYSYIPKTSLSEILATLTAGELSLPKSFDLDFVENTIQLHKTGSDYSFLLATEVNDIGTLALHIGKQSGQWGSAFGLVLNEPELSKLPGLKALRVIDDKLTLSQLTLLVSSFDSPGFTFPELASFSNPSLNASSIPMPTSGGVVKGFNGHATLTLDTKAKDMKLLKQVLGLDPSLLVTLQVATNPSDATRVFTSINTSLLGKHPLSAQFGFLTEKGQVSLYLTGQLTVKIQKQPVNFNMAMSLLPGGIYFAGSALGSLHFGNIKLSNMGLAMGINWGGIPSLGIAAQIDTKRFSSSIAVIADSTDPSKSVLAGSISQLSLADITEEFAKVAHLPKEVNQAFKSIKLRSVRTFSITANTVSALDSKDHEAVSNAFSHEGVVIPASAEMLLIVVRKQGRIWSLTDMSEGMRHYTVTLKDKMLEVAVTPQVYIAPIGARMGELTFTQGYYLSGCLQILGERWATQVEISDRKGIAATSYITKPIQIASKDFFRFSDYDDKKGPMISLSSFKQPKHEIKALRNPHIALSGRLRLLGQESATLANITAKGVVIIVESDTSITLKENFIQGRYDLDWKIEGSLGSLTDMFLSGAIHFLLNGKFELARLLNVKADLGKLKIKTSASTDLEMGYQNNKAYIELDGRFTFAGEHFSFNIEASAKNTQLDKLGKLVLNEIKTIVADLYDTAEEWLNALDDGVIEISKAAGSVGKALKSGYKQTSKETTRLLNKSGRTAEEIGNELKHGFNTSAQGAAKLLKDVGHDADSVTRMLQKSFGCGAKDITKTLKDIGHSANTVAKSLRKVTRASPSVIAKEMKAAGVNGHDIGNALKNIGESDEAVGKLLKGAGFAVKDVSKVLKNTLRVDSEKAAKYLRSAGFGSKDIAKMLKAGDLWNKGHKSVAKAMKKAGFGKGTVKSAMKAAGFAKKKVEEAFSWLKF